MHPLHGPGQRVGKCSTLVSLRELHNRDKAIYNTWLSYAVNLNFGDCNFTQLHQNDENAGFFNFNPQVHVPLENVL